MPAFSRRGFLEIGGAIAAAMANKGGRFNGLHAADKAAASPLTEFGYADVTLASDLHESQFKETQQVLMALSGQFAETLPANVWNACAG